MKLILGVLVPVLSLVVSSAMAESFIFGGNANGLAGQESASLTDVGFQLSLQAGPAGAVFNESDSDGMGIDSRGIEGVTDGGSVGDPDKFNIIDGTAPVSGQGEFVTFSFDTPGVIETLLFDGLKDETLEYFTLEFPDASVVTFFDAQAELRLTDQGFQLSDLGVPNPTLASDDEDDFPMVEYAFAAGEQFKVTYGQIDFASVLPGYLPATGGLGNGARFQGIVVRPIPEPATALLGLLAGALAVTARRYRRVRE